MVNRGFDGARRAEGLGFVGLELLDLELLDVVN